MTVGFQPLAGSDQQLVDGTWVNGVAAGLNASYLSGVTAAGSSHGAATQLSGGYKLISVDTSTASTGLGVALPFAVPGTQILIYNNTANNCTVYPAIANNPNLATPAQDKINNTTSLSLNAHTSRIFFCALVGFWGAE